MKRSFKMNNLECANCASKMETDINKLPGVNKASISFMTQRFVLDANDDAFDSTLDSAQQIVKKYEPDCSIVIK